MCGRFASYLLAEAVSGLFHTVSPIPNFPATWMGSGLTNSRTAPVKASGPFSSVKLRAELPRGYRVNLHCTFGSV